MNLERKILSDPINEWVFSFAKKDIYLVGGYIRDLLNTGHCNKDRDFIVKDDIRKIALKTAEKFNGTFIELKKDFTCRVALKNGDVLDFSHIQNTISEDLSKRDYTINALAWSPEKGLIDLFNGLKELNRKVIKVINNKNLIDDPLRVLRAYRIAAQLGLTFENGTRNYLKKYSGGLKFVSPERITDELFKLLCTDNASRYISMCVEDQVLPKVLGLRTRKLKQNLILLRKLDKFFVNLKKSNSRKSLKIRLVPFLRQNIGQGLSRAGLIRLSILLNLHDTSEFRYGYLRYSNSIKKKLKQIHYSMRIIKGRITCDKLFNIFSAADDCEFELALILSALESRNVNKYFKRADDFLKFKKNKLLNGYEIQKILISGPSEIIGRIQSDIHKRRFLGLIRRKEDAVHWIISNFT